MFGSAGWTSPRGSNPADVPNGPLDALARWSVEQPDRTVYTFVGDKGEQLASLTYLQLERASDALARHLRFAVKLKAGDRVLLVYPPGLDFIVAFLACLRAGLIAVPAFPPEPTRLSKDLALFAGTAANSGAKVALTNSLYSHAKKLAGLAQLLRLSGGGRWPDLLWIVSDTLNAAAAPAGELARPQPSDVAFLQYTSGSTAEPKGVRITHANLAHNTRWIVAALAVDRSTVEVSWLPQYHDMGLIGAYLGLLVCGGEGTYLSPFSFVRDATLWPRLLSEKRATHTQAPSFAYALAARKWNALDARSRPQLKLGSLRHSVNGAEPIDPEAMAAFVAAFAPYGLRREAVVPTYGLAEHTVFVCTGGKLLLAVERAALEEKAQVRVAREGASGTVTLVGCGAPPDGSGIEIRIVGAGGVAVGSDCVGEVWLRSPSVADGYWANADGKGPLAALSAETFGATLAAEPGVAYLRTGDLGFMHGGEVFLCGRSKDLLIVSGRNHYPQDLERSAEKAAAELRPGCCVVFAVPTADAAAAKSAEARAAAARAAGGGGAFSMSELVVVVAELRKEHAAKAAEVAARVAQAVASAHSITVHAVVLIAQGSIHKTKSGKLSRTRTRNDFLGHTPTPLAVLYARDAAEAPAEEADAAAPPRPTSAPPTASPAPPAPRPPASASASALRGKAMAELVADVKARIAFEANISEELIDVRKPLVTLGIGSMELVQIRGMLDTLYELDFEESVLATDQATIEKIAAAIKAGKIPDSMAKATVILQADAADADPAVTQHSRPHKRAGPPCCVVQ